MDPKDHSKKVIAKKVRKSRESNFVCDNCRETFTSLAAKRAHEEKQHKKRHA